MTIRNVASLAEALSVKKEMNYNGDYTLQTWEKGKEIVLKFPDSLVHLRWVAFIRPELPFEKVEDAPSVSEVVFTEPAPDSFLKDMQGSNVFSRGRERSILI